MPELALRALLQSILSGSTSIEDPALIDAVARRLITAGLTVNAAGLVGVTGGMSVTGGLTLPTPLSVANGGTGVTTSTGTTNVVLSNSPTLVSPALGTPASGVATNLTGLPLTTGITGTLPVLNGGTGTTTSTGSGNTVLSTNPVFVTPELGTPTSGIATNLTGLPLTTGVTGTLPIANGGTNSAIALTNNQLMKSSVGTIIEAGAMTNGQLLIGSTGASPVVAALTAGSNITITNAAGAITVASTAGSVSLLKSGSGTDVNAAATNVDSVAISGLTLNDVLTIRYTVESVTQQTGNPVFYNNTDGVNVASTTDGAALITSYGVVYGYFQVSRGQASNTAIGAIGAFTRTGGTGNQAIISTFTTGWTGAWTLAFRHNGVTAGGTFRWTWEVFKVTGQ